MKRERENIDHAVAVNYPPRLIIINNIHIARYNHRVEMLPLSYPEQAKCYFSVDKIGQWSIIDRLFELPTAEQVDRFSVDKLIPCITYHD